MKGASDLSLCTGAEAQRWHVLVKETTSLQSPCTVLVAHLNTADGIAGDAQPWDRMSPPVSFQILEPFVVFVTRSLADALSGAPCSAIS